MSLPGMLGRGEDAVEPMGLCCGAVLLPVIASFAYRLGYVLEKLIWRKRPDRHWAPILYKLALAFTTSIFLVPALLALVVHLVNR